MIEAGFQFACGSIDVHIYDFSMLLLCFFCALGMVTSTMVASCSNYFYIAS
jgi:hypothetical protein